MDNTDLDIANYTLNDIIKLFKISYNLTLSEMKSAKKIVLKMHPDKSKLDGEYYIFFSAAYKLLLKIYEYKNKGDTINSSNKNTEYSNNITMSNNENIKNNNKSLDIFFEKNDFKNNPTKFNKWFNSQFDNIKISSQFEKTGYGDWLKSDKDLIHCDKANNIREMNSSILDIKHKVREMTLTNAPVNDMYMSNIPASSLSCGDSLIDNYSSDIFSNLKYQDLKQAHIETVIPITEDDYNTENMYNSVEECIRDRGQAQLTPMGKKDADQYFTKQSQNMENESTINAFSMLQDFEKQQNKTSAFWNNIRTITN
jgi:hypothetical protein